MPKINSIAVLCASGLGKRLGFITPKALVPLEHQPLFIYPLKTLIKSPIDKIIITTPKPHLKLFKAAAEKFIPKNKQNKILDIISGGKTRQESVLKALIKINQTLNEPDTLVPNPKNPAILVHNAANIFLDQTDIKNCLNLIKKNYTTGVFLPSVDTLRKVDKNFSPIKKLNRNSIVRMQTPQGSNFKLLFKAYQQAQKDKFEATDEIEIIERYLQKQKLDEKIKLVQTNNYNFKITFAEDLEVAKKLTPKSPQVGT
jgi:2-C-methyl-D-erythritol 4-phosphate cytidylyltransferase